MFSPLKLLKQNHNVNASSAQILSGSDSLQCQKINITHRPVQKLPPPIKQYLYFQMDGKTAHIEQCSKSCELTKLIDLILEIEPF